MSDDAKTQWQHDYAAQMPADDARHNRSGIEVKPIYSAADRGLAADGLGYPGQPPYTRGIYPSMHRGRPWSQRQLIGLATPIEYNARMREIVDAGATALSLIPCNSVYRGFDIDEVDPVLLGTCGTTVNTSDDMQICLDGVPIERTSVALNDPSPFTLLALLLVEAKRRGNGWETITGTSNQSDYISHYVANHMFFRLALDGARRVFCDHVAFTNQHVPRWNPISVVGQHMQQAGATPAEAMGFTLSTAIQYVDDLIASGLDPDDFLPRFTFFFDISMSFFEEIAKLRAGRRIWARVTRERFGAKDPRSWRFKFHAQTSGVDLTRQQPLNNIARTAIQAMAGIFGGLQSLHTDAFDEVLSTPTRGAAEVAVATQNILREEAHLDDVIDPLGGSHYVESLTDDMEAKIVQVMETVENAGGMFKAVSDGLVQRMIGDSALAYQQRVESGEQTIVGVNAYQSQIDDTVPVRPLERPDPDLMQQQIDALARFKQERSEQQVRAALDALARSTGDAGANVFAEVVAATEAGVTHGEICACLRREFGMGQPLIAA